MPALNPLSCWVQPAYQKLAAHYEHVVWAKFYGTLLTQSRLNWLGPPLLAAVLLILTGVRRQ